MKRAVRKALSSSGAEIDQHDPRAVRGGDLLDLREAVRGRRIDPGHQPEIEHQEAAFRLPRQQRLDVLIEPIGRAEKQIALQGHALDLAAVFGQERQFAAARDRATSGIPSRRSRI